MFLTVPSVNVYLLHLDFMVRLQSGEKLFLRLAQNCAVYGEPKLPSKATISLFWK